MMHPMDKTPTPREIILCITAACGVADSVVKQRLLAELATTLTYINYPLVETTAVPRPKGETP